MRTAGIDLPTRQRKTGVAQDLMAVPDSPLTGYPS